MGEAEAVVFAVDALRAVGISADAGSNGPDRGFDLVLEPGGTPIDITYRALVDGSVARRLLRERASRSGVVLVVLADRITSEARRLLVEGGAGYYDLRGHLALRTPTLVIDTDVEPVGRPEQIRDPFAGRASLEVAMALLMRPHAGLGVRALARLLDRAPSTVSQSLAGFSRAGLIDEEHNVLGDQLFWAAAEHWASPRSYLAKPPPNSVTSPLHAPLRLGLERVEETSGWALTDALAAVEYGAPVAVRANQVRDFYVPDIATLQRAKKLLGTVADQVEAAASVRVAPTSAACDFRFEGPGVGGQRWPLAHPVFVALDLAHDAGRGREVLDGWTPPAKWSRVW